MQNLTAIFEPAEEGGYVCWVEEIPGACSQGETLAEAKLNLIDAIQSILAYRREEAESIFHDLRVKKINVIKDFIPLEVI